MFNILVVEDRAEKLKNIIQLLSKVDGIDVHKIDSEIDAMSTKNKLKTNFYDLMILDIAIPPSRDKDIDNEGGIKLLNEVYSRSMYKKPTHIIGLTAEGDVYEKAVLEFSDKLLNVIRYSQSDIEWEDRVFKAVKNWVESKTSQKYSVKAFDFDVVIVCALREEFDANLANGWDWEEYILENDSSTYYKANVKNQQGIIITVIAGLAQRMGMPSATAISMKMILTFRPKYIIMTGIMAGVAGRVRLGDIVICDPVWDWGSGKWKIEGDKSLFDIDPYQFGTDLNLLKRVKSFQSNEDYLFKLRNKYGKGRPETDLCIHIGAVASGASVLSDSEKFSEIKSQHRKLLGIEMESYGVFSAVEISPDPKPMAISIKSVVDFGDAEKGDDFHNFGSYVSAHFTKDLIENIFQ